MRGKVSFMVSCVILFYCDTGRVDMLMTITARCFFTKYIGIKNL